MSLSIKGKKSLLEVDENHIRVNSHFTGQIITNKNYSGSSVDKRVRAELVLTCWQRRTSSVNSSIRQREREIDIDPIWQDCHFVDVTLGHESPSRVKFDLSIPNSVLRSDPERKTGILWKLEVKWELNGKTFKDKFELEVEKSEGLSPIELPIMSKQNLIEHCRDQKIKFSSSDELFFPRFRNIIRGIFPLIMGILVLGGGIALTVFDVTIIGCILLSLVGLMFIIPGLYQIFEQRTFSVSSGKLNLKSSSIFGRKNLNWNFNQVKRIYMVKSNYINSTLYYKIVLMDVDRKRNTIGDGIEGISFAISLAKFFNDFIENNKI